MKKKLLDRRGAAIELAIMMMVFSIFITTIILTTALLQNEHKAKAELGIQQDIFLEQLGEDFVNAVKDDKLVGWKPEYNGETIPQETVVTHIWESRVVEPTCQAEGYTLHTCALCEETKKTDVKPMAKHSVIPYGEDYKYVIEDCIKTETGKCRECGEIVDVATPVHSWGDYITLDPTCTTDGYKTRTCTECREIDQEIVTAALGHIQGEKIGETSPDCTQDGKVIYSCTRCRNSYEEKGILATGHNYVINPAETSSCERTQTCSEYGDTQAARAAHTFDEVEGSCKGDTIATLICTTCEMPQEVKIPAAEHKFDANSICTECGINKEEIRYSLIVIKLKNGTYMLQVDTLKGKASEPAEGEIVDGDIPADDSAENLEEADICPAGGTLVLKITVSNLAGTYKITEWSKK